MFRSIHLRRGRRLLAVAGAASRTDRRQRSPLTTAAGAAERSAPASAPAAAAAQPGGAKSPKPTVVLVHGGWADSSGWNDEISALQKKGYPVIAPANPLRGLTSDADYIRSVLQTIPGPIVLVGHSYGGAVISNAARGVVQRRGAGLHRGLRTRHRGVPGAAGRP